MSYLIMILHKLYNHSYVFAVVFDRDDSHNIGSIFSIGILAIFIGQYQAGISFVYLRHNQSNHTMSQRSGTKRYKEQLVQIKCINIFYCNRNIFIIVGVVAVVIMSSGETCGKWGEHRKRILCAKFWYFKQFLGA